LIFARPPPRCGAATTFSSPARTFHRNETPSWASIRPGTVAGPISTAIFPIIPKDAEPGYMGYSIGKWLDAAGDGRFDTLEVETRNFKGPRTYEPSGIPLHEDNQSVIKERIFLDKSDRDVLHNEITVYHALTRPWTVDKLYRRLHDVFWYEDNCTEDNHHVVVGKVDYFVSGDGYVMPAQKEQAPPDLRYFKPRK
jgi:hypothetical protein